ncbi:MAG: hypothetical protein KA399_03695 [Chitinophagaceae bacterium]|nr:hypothetical protein [Chitinophagaceae bacterium]
MTKIGELNDRQIFFTNVRVDLHWFDKLPSSNWLAFTIADTADKELLSDTTKKCLDSNVLYTCNAGQLGSDTEDYFDEEIVWRQVQIEERTGKPQDYKTSPMTTSHRNFDEGFWFATTVANATAYDEYIPIDKVVCIDMTQQGVKKYLLELIDKIKNGWLPSDKEIEVPKYDTE